MIHHREEGAPARRGVNWTAGRCRRGWWFSIILRAFGRQLYWRYRSWAPVVTHFERRARP
jgi:hypothetical protein